MFWGKIFINMYAYIYSTYTYIHIYLHHNKYQIQSDGKYIKLYYYLLL